MAARRKPTKKASLKTRVTKTAKNVGSKVATTGRTVRTKVVRTGKNVGKAVGRGAQTAKGKTVAAFGAVKQKIQGKDEEE